MEKTTHKIYFGNSNQMKEISDGSVQLIITSPPYPMIEMWDKLFISQDASIKEDLENFDTNSAFKKMHAVLNKVWSECDRVLMKNGFICINIGDATRTFGENFKLYPNHAQIINFFSNIGYSVLPDIHWRKQSNSPNKFMGSGMYPAGAYVTYEHEYILIFRKGGKRKFTSKNKNLRQKSAYFWEERNIWFSDLWDIKGTNQTIKTAKLSRERNASFPLEIPYRLVNMYSVEGDVVLDPFTGLGTTNLACMLSKRNSIGYEIDKDIASLAINNISAEKEKLNKYIDNRIIRHIDFIDSLPLEKRQLCYKNKPHGFDVKTRQEVDISINSITSIKNSIDSIECYY